MYPGRRGNHRGGGRNSGWRSQGPRQHRWVPAANSSGDDSSTPGSGSSDTRRHSGTSSIHGLTHELNDLSTSEHPQEPIFVGTGVRNIPPNATNSTRGVDQSPKQSLSQPVSAPGGDNDYSPLSATSTMVRSYIEKENTCKGEGSPEDPMTKVECGSALDWDNGYSPLSETCTMVRSCIEEENTCKGEDSGVQAGQSPEDPMTKVECGSAHFHVKGLSFDICGEKNGKVVTLKKSLLETNKAKRNVKKRHMQGENILNIRPGMILLKGYLSLENQIKLIKSCKELGKGRGGFYEPGYRNGATLHLKMMCLGKHWDPETGKYLDERPIDETKPPPIPDEFLQLVEKAITECHGYLESHTKEKSGRRILPSMSPDICIINFYSRTGKLGLHQDKDESSESLREGLPVVSFSLGDTADFRFGDEGDIEKSQKVDLESGDVLIFGGKSRHVFHGVSSIKPSSAPEDLIKETNLKPGRLNLTFRKY